MHIHYFSIATGKYRHKEKPPTERMAASVYFFFPKKFLNLDFFSEDILRSDSPASCS